MDHPYPRTFGDHNTPTRPHAPTDPADPLDDEENAAGQPCGAAPMPESARRAARHDGWAPERRARFCELIAEGMTVEAACFGLGKSVSSAYALKRRPDGASFALAWEAANLVSRGYIADRLLSRALDGQVERVVRPNGDTVERHRFDNRLALSMLARLDRLADAAAGSDGAAARLVAQDFDGFVDLLRRDAAPARAGLFLLHAGQTGAADLAPIAALARADEFLRAAPSDRAADLAGLDADQRAQWTAEDWRRAELGGLVAFAAPARPVEEQADEPPLPPLHADGGGADEPEPVWWDDDADDWRTSFPPPEDFDGVETQIFGHIGYTRALTEGEATLMGAGPDWYDDDELAEQTQAREAWFAAAAGHGGPATGSPPTPAAPSCPEARAHVAPAPPPP